MKDRLKERRKELKLSLQVVADNCGSSKGYIWELENKGVLKPSAKKLKDIAAALNTTVDYLLTGDKVGVTESVLLNTYNQLHPHNKASLMEIVGILLKNQNNNQDELNT